MRLLAILVVIVLFPTLVLAGPIEDAQNSIYRRDYPAAIKTLQPLANEGNPDAERLYGQMFEQGLGLKQDVVEAMKWYRKAAAQGDAAAMFKIALYFQNLADWNAYSPDYHYDEVCKLYVQLAQKGYAYAYSFAGDCYDSGRAAGISRNEQEAYFWYGLNRVRDGSFIKRTIERIQNSLTVDQIAKQEKRIKEWKIIHPIPSGVIGPMDVKD